MSMSRSCVAVLLALLLAACGPTDPGPAGTAPAPSPPAGERARPADALDVPAFRAKELASSLWEDPVQYLRERGHDPSLAGLVAVFAGRADPAPSPEERAAALEALADRAGDAFAPLVAGLLDAADAPSADLLPAFLANLDDRVAVRWLDRRIAAATAADLPALAAARADLGVPDPAVAAAVAARAAETGLADAPTILRARAALGDPAAEAALPSVLAGNDLLELHARRQAPGFEPLLEELLAEPYVPTRVRAARTAGAFRVRAAVPPLRAALAAARKEGENAEDLVPVALWALGRCGEADAVPALLDFLAGTDWYRAAGWAVDALLDLDAAPGRILLALPDAPFSLSRLPEILARIRMADLESLKKKVASLSDGPLRRALVLAETTGAGPEAREYLRRVVDGGGNLGLYLTFTTKERVREFLASDAGEFDRRRALLAVPMLPAAPAEKVAIAAGTLADAAPVLRRTAADVLAELGGAAAADALAARLPVETAPAVRERIARALVATGAEAAVPALLRAFDDPAAIASLPPAVAAPLLPLLGRTEDARAGEALRAAFASEATEVRLAAARGLAERGDADAVGALRAAAVSGDPLARALGLEGLLATAPDALRALVADAKDPVVAGYGVLFRGVRREADRGMLFEYERLR